MFGQQAIYSGESHRNIYVACEDLNFVWNEDQLQDVIDLWNFGVPIDYMARHLGREQEEVVILAIDLSRKGRIGSRPGGLMGAEGMV